MFQDISNKGHFITNFSMRSLFERQISQNKISDDLTEYIMNLGEFSEYIEEFIPKQNMAFLMRHEGEDILIISFLALKASFRLCQHSFWR